MTNSTSETIGCDLGDKMSDVCVMDVDGRTRRARVASTRKGMTTFFTREPAHVVIEVGGHSRWVSELLEVLGHRVTIANARRVKLISASDNKTDEHDAELLARLGRADARLLAPMVHRRPEVQADLAIAKARDALVATRTKLVNHVRGTVKSFGERLPKCGSVSFVRHTRALIPPALQTALAPVYETIAKLDEQIREQDKVIERTAEERYPDVAVLAQVNGVGVLTALVYVLTLEDKNRFTSSRMAGAYIGLRPRKRKSGNDDPQLRITKAGDPFVRRLLVLSANYILGPFGKDSDLRRWGIKLAERGGKNAKKRAKVAVARKLAVLLHRLWVTGEVYEPLGYQSRRLDDAIPQAAPAPPVAEPGDPATNVTNVAA
jgi:transposase